MRAWSVVRVSSLLIFCWLCAVSGLALEPGLYSPNCYRGETFTRVLTWTDSGGSLVNLTGYTAKLQLRNSTTGTVLDEFTDVGGLELGGVAGTITWTMTAVETLALPVGSAAYDLRLTSPAGVVTYLLSGYVNVKDTVTR